MAAPGFIPELNRRVVAALAVGLVGTAASLNAQSVLKGTVLDPGSHQPLSLVEVSLPALNLRATSQPNGTFVLSPIAAGLRLVMLRRVGYRPRAINLAFGPADTVEVEFDLTPVAAVLDSISVTADGPRSGLARRQRLGFGQFVSRNDLAAHRDQRFSDLLRSFKGIRVNPRASGGTAVYSQRGGGFGGGPCALDVWVDGVFKGAYEPTLNIRNEREPVNIDDFPPDGLESVEVYAGTSEVPVEFQGPEGTCGAILLWRRQLAPQ